MPRKRKTVDEIKAEIDAREAAARQRRAERGPTGAAANPEHHFKKKRKLTPAERYELEKEERRKKGATGYGYSGYRTTGSRSHGSEYKPSIREEIVIDCLLEGGYASDIESAQAILSAMSDEWFYGILDEDLGVDASRLVSNILSRPRSTPQEIEAGAARIRGAVSGVGRKLAGGAKSAFGWLDAGPEVNREKIQSRRPQGSIQRRVAADTARTLNR